MPDQPLIDGDLRFARGLNSFSDPAALPEEGYAYSLNMLNRGGPLQARPGFDTAHILPDGELQGFIVYYPQNGLPQHVSVVDGQLYISDYPYKTCRAVPGLRMSPKAKRVHLELALKAVNRSDVDGSLSLLDSPYTVLMMQDGISPPSFYDGHSVRRVPGLWPTPQGTLMKWAGGRLWVARGNIVFASDIGDPLCFYEQQYNTLGGVSFYVLPEVVTAFALTPGIQKPQLLAFTNNTTTSFRSDIRERDLWNQTPDFQYVVFPGLGCVAPLSLTTHAGQLWWYSQTGFINLDTATATMQTIKTRSLDNEMIRSKSRLASDITGIAAVGFGNFLLASVPSASRFNTHTWVLDTSSIDTLGMESPLSWSSVWTGVRPVAWQNVVIGGTTTLYCASADADGHNRVYRAFGQPGRDNGVDFPWRVESRGYNGKVASAKKFRFMEYSLSELAGQVDIKFSWASPTRGQWKPFATVRFEAQEGNIDAGQVFSDTATLFGLKKQSRIGRTEDINDLVENSLSSAGVEGPIYSLDPNLERIDTAFQVCIEGSGPCSIRALRLFFTAETDPPTGQAAKPEGDDHFVRFDGAAANNEAALEADPVSFSATKRAEAKYGNYAGAASATVTSRVSQMDADKRAEQTALARANYQLGRIAPVYVGGTIP